IPADSRKKEAAWEVIKWLLSKQTQKILAVEGFAPIRESTFVDEDILADPFAQKVYPGLMRSLEVSKARPRIPEWPEMTEVITLRLHQALSGELTNEAALRLIQSDWERIFRESGRY
ncbi:hypothetical protein IBX65_09230, partial [Candidatus Aerophobetes bacterium]|nr:hypothetical protein [Candidatus Aerophobetes bacterium]